MNIQDQIQKLKPTATCGLVVTGCVLASVMSKPVMAQSLRAGSETNYIEVYGQFNKGFLFYDDGNLQKWYPLVDNDSSSSRFGLRAHDR